MATARVPTGCEARWSVQIAAKKVSPPGWAAREPSLALVWHRFLPAHDEVGRHEQKARFGVDFTADWSRADSREKRNLQSLAASWHGAGVLEWFARLALRPPALAERAMERRRRAFGAAGVWEYQVRTRWRLVIGQANAALVENSGIVIHRLYGFPAVPGASLKGLARHFWQEEAASRRAGGGDSEPAWQAIAEELGGPEPAGDVLFGAAGGEGAEGSVAFFDAWPIGDAALEVDVLTPHHRQYYADGTVPPSDTENPVPACFLAVAADVGFEFGIGLTAVGRRLDPDRQSFVVTAAAVILREALARWGVGAKTGSGYGRMAAVGALAELKPGAGR
jgi:CRISPR-associated protein Cmr6